jgi:hypothetical protein
MDSLTFGLKRWKPFKHVSGANQAATVRAVGASRPANLGRTADRRFKALADKHKSIAQHSTAGSTVSKQKLQG